MLNPGSRRKFSKRATVASASAAMMAAALASTVAMGTASAAAMAPTAPPAPSATTSTTHGASDYVTVSEAQGRRIPEADFTPASACLNETAPPDAIVAQPESDVAFYNLICGDESRGIIHISDEHTISLDGYDDQNIVTCANKIAGQGHPIDGQGQFIEGFEIERSNGGYARLFYNDNTGYVKTMFTVPDSNNWAACAAY